jgi:hypothetical protein
MYPMSVQWNPSLMFLDLRIFLIQWSFWMISVINYLCLRFPSV